MKIILLIKKYHGFTFSNVKWPFCTKEMQYIAQAIIFPGYQTFNEHNAVKFNNACDFWNMK